MKPRSLKLGDKIGVMAPSSRCDRAVVEKGADALQKLGYEVYLHPQTFAAHNQSAGTEAQKLKALNDLFRDKDVKAIVAARGGNRAGYLLEKIDYDLVRRNPKIVMGFSDVTALLFALNKKAGLTTFHGPMMGSFGKGLDEDQLRQCFNLLAGADNDLPLENARVVRKGRAEGRLVGGNLSLVSSLVGTPYMPALKGAILFLEDCSDEISRFDRMLLHLKNAGVFDKIAGLVVGDFTDIKDGGSKPFGFTLEDVVRAVTKDRDFPIVMDAPFGHGKRIYTHPVGAKAELTATVRQAPALRLLKPAVIP